MWIRKFPGSHVSVFKSNLPVHTYPSLRTASEEKRLPFAGYTCPTRIRICCHLEYEYSIHGKELVSILLRHRIKYPNLASTRFRIPHNVLKNFHSGERIRMPDSPDTCGRKPYRERKSWGFYESQKKGKPTHIFFILHCPLRFWCLWTCIISLTSFWCIHFYQILTCYVKSRNLPKLWGKFKNCLRLITFGVD